MQLSKINKTDFKSTAPDAWEALKAFTPARIALGRTGTSVPLSEAFALKLAHAHARDAVYSALQTGELYAQLKTFGLPVLNVQSKATRRTQYLQRPDLGRQPDTESIELLNEHAGRVCDIAIIVADGLSAAAVNTHTLPLMSLLIPKLQSAGYSLAPITIAAQARVAIADEIGQLLKAKISIILIGERPGLSSTMSLSAYLTYNPKPGTTDEKRNCISNIRSGGLSFQSASDKIFYLVQESLRRKFSGVHLKDEMGLIS